MKKQPRDTVHIEDRVKDKDNFEIWACTPQLIGGIKKMFKIAHMVSVDCGIKLVTIVPRPGARNATDHTILNCIV